ncbi:hypothetical protein [Vulcanisaeta souniana]|uniref:hypothetical protein n=1 Tax=Vulcanisaeta souniana TaxID=164452 RepID=UPI001FB289D9|nr:hypothetical protein [Vulcanisaeta souniana]
MMMLSVLVIIGALVIVVSILSSLLSLYFEIKYWRDRKRISKLINNNDGDHPG